MTLRPYMPLKPTYPPPPPGEGCTSEAGEHIKHAFTRIESTLAPSLSREEGSVRLRPRVQGVTAKHDTQRSKGIAGLQDFRIY